MAFTFSDTDLQRIASVLGVPAKHEGALARFELHEPSSGRRIALEITRSLDALADVPLDQPANLVSVYAASAFLQLQACTGYLASAELGEVLFVARRGNGVANGLVVEREAGCSLFANVDERLLSTDFTKLPPELIMSSVALSMTETLFNDLG